MYTIDEASNILGVHPTTLRRWEKEGKITSSRTTGGHRRYAVEDLSAIKHDLKPLQDKIVIGYCRVSSSDQKEELKRQVHTVSQYCSANGYQFRIIKDLGNGLNFDKKGLKELIRLVQSNQVEKVVVNYKDRLLRFGYELLEQICAFHHVKIEIVNHTEDKTYEQELVEDMLSIITVFSSRLYGSRSHKRKKLQQAVKQVIEDNGHAYV
ncbi:IS607 family transposase [Lentibacillus daqui]|uniref:IS607 family transposase n=1 Tax=Lentibacillus daqui TaxID=2911514 RepID=UPI0022B195F1|nr:IS607 family transposase [Lentibacillus daqui]